jgi:2,3-dihydroxyphenylpropionate 1,2-dioxygenase
MSLVYAGVCSHGPGITARADRADPVLRDEFYRNLGKMRDDIKASGAEALIVVAAEHFANFFMNNMPAYCMGMADEYEGPIEDPDWLKIPRTKIPGNPGLSKRIIKEMMQTVDLSFSEEWKFDHGISVPLNFLTPEYDMPIIPANINCQGPPLTPLHRAWAFGEAIRRACDAVPEKVALVGTGGISHWPATPDSGKINLEWDTEFLTHFAKNDKDFMLHYTDEETYRDGGQGGYEIRTFIATAAAAQGAQADIHFFEPIPIFATSCVCASFNL